MSPEINGNPPSVTKRKKNKKPSTSSNTSASAFDLNASMSNNCNSFYAGSSPYHNLSIPDISNYYSFVNYSNASTEPMSLPIFPNLGYHPPPPTAPYIPPPSNFLGHFSTPKPGTLPANFLNNDTTSEYLSLPVVNPDQNDDDESKRRYSDPGLPNDSDSSSNSYDDRLVQKLCHQVNILRESNKRLQREVMELRFEVNMLKSQNFRHYEREYEPGMLADIIREVRDAARVREDALLARVKHMIEEKQLNMNHLHLVNEKNRNNDRITKLEEQLKSLTVNPSRLPDHVSTSTINTTADDVPNSARQVLELEQEALELRRELQDARAKKEEADHKYLQYV